MQPSAPWPRAVAGDLNGDGRLDIGLAAPPSATWSSSGGSSGVRAPTTVDPDGQAGGTTGGSQPARGPRRRRHPRPGGAQLITGPAGEQDLDPARSRRRHVRRGEPRAVGISPGQVVSADFNRDGNPDLAASNSGTGNVSLLLAIPPSVSVTPSLAFGNQAPNTDSAGQTIVVRNNGAPRLRPGAVALGGANADNFRIVSNSCTGANLAIGQECGVGVVFRPTGLGGRSAAVSIASNGGGSPHVVSLGGTGANPTGLIVGNCANLQNGTANAETLTGTAEGDNLFGFAGADVLNGLGGNDCLIGGDGNDRLNGGEGRDTLEGNNGNDVEDGGNGNDRMSGGAGRDRMSGGAGNDSLNGVSSNDTISGGAGNDTLSGSTGNDRINGAQARTSTQAGRATTRSARPTGASNGSTAARAATACAPTAATA